MKILICLAALVALAAGAAIEHSAAPNSAPALRDSLLPRLTDTRIVGGSNVNIAKHPHQISMRYKNILTPQSAFGHRCGGSIISANTIVTAAHCIIATVPSQFQIVAGTSQRTGSDGAIVPVKEIVMHEGYNPDTYDNDIALLILAAPLPLNNFTISTIELGVEDPKEGATATITGWGTTQSGGTAPSYLQAVQVPVVSNANCNEDYSGLITDSMLCAGLRGVGGKDSCQGDSGGPLVINGKLAGVVSWGFGCARPEFPGVYAKVSYLRKWLDEKIALHSR